VRIAKASLIVPRGWLVWSIVLFVLTFVLGFLAKAGLFAGQLSLDVALNRMHSSFLDSVARALDLIDHPLVVVVIVAIVFVIVGLTRTWWIALGACLAAGLGWITTLVVKQVVAQVRPGTGSLEHLLHLTPATLSFPSGHVVFVASLGVAVAMAYSRRTVRVWLIVATAVLVVVVGWSRLYVGLHYPVDVVGGILNGVAGALLFAGLWNILARRVFGNGRRVADRNPVASDSVASDSAASDSAQ
jgi:undecaprenyl-diphosphatase